MDLNFSSNLSQLRREFGLSQRKLAADLNISQALLSHYENGTREPGLPFIWRVCDYFEVSADFILGRKEQSGTEGLSAVDSELFRSIEFSSPEVRSHALAYLNAATRRVSAHIHNRKSPLESAQAALDMSEAELALLRSLARVKED